MNKENNEKIVNEIIEYANHEIKRSKKKHLIILLSVLISVIILSVALLTIFTYIDGYVMWLLTVFLCLEKVIDKFYKNVKMV